MWIKIAGMIEGCFDGVGFMTRITMGGAEGLLMVNLLRWMRSEFSAMIIQRDFFYFQ